MSSTKQRALVIRTVGDPDIAGAIVDGMTRNITPLNSSELAAVRAEVVRLKARNDILAVGTQNRFRQAFAALAIKYPTETHGRLYNAILGVWGLLWMTVYAAYDYFSAWNRR